MPFYKMMTEMDYGVIFIGYYDQVYWSMNRRVLYSIILITIQMNYIDTYKTMKTPHSKYYESLAI